MCVACFTAMQSGPPLTVEQMISCPTHFFFSFWVKKKKLGGMSRSRYRFIHYKRYIKVERVFCKFIIDTHGFKLQTMYFSVQQGCAVLLNSYSSPLITIFLVVNFHLLLASKSVEVHV